MMQRCLLFIVAVLLSAPIFAQHAPVPPPPPPPPPLNFEDVFKVVEEMPRFPGCEESDRAERQQCSQKKMLEYLYANISYPAAARKAGVEGTVVIKFIVDKSGQLRDHEIIRRIGGGCDEEALRVIQMFPDFIPGKQRGLAVNVQYLLPIRFKLFDDSEPKQAATERITQQPRFSGCEFIQDMEQRKACANEKMQAHILQHLTYPTTAIQRGIQGVVVVTFTIDKLGDVRDITINKDLEEGCGEAVMEMLAGMPRWIPALEDGTPVATKMTLPVVFNAKGQTPTDNLIDKPMVEKNLGLHLFPNPARQQATIEWTAQQGSAQIRVFDLQGRLLHELNIDASQGQLVLDLPTDLPAGNYVVHLVIDNKVQERQLVIRP